MVRNQQEIGYLPDERPPVWKLLLYALQQVIVMFPATVAVAIITGFHISTTIFASGFATICFILVTGRKIPLYYGSSFSYVAAIGSLMTSEALAGLTLNEKISIAQFGIVMSGFVSIIAGLIVNRFGRDSIEKILPASITGPIAMVIGLTLAGTALSDAASIAIDTAGTVVVADSQMQLAKNMAWIISLVTLISTILFSVYLKGFMGQLPLILGPIVGCLATFIINLATGINLFKVLPETANSGIFALPIFTLPKPSAMAVAAIMPIAIATIPESTAHVYQLDIYVNDLAKKKGTGKKFNIADKLGLNLIGDGIGDIVSGLVGGPAGTNYGENISAMAITRIFSVPVIIAASIIAMVIACFTPLVNAIYSIPTAVIGGMEIYLFGAIAAQGVAIMVEKKVDLFSSKNIAVIATIMVIGLGGQYAFGGNIPFFGVNVPCIAGAAIFGILLNLVLSIGEKKAKADEKAST
ncbi:xanthine permease [Clostridium thermosuccinogenes]|uniref:Xanthine permease n=1 Tax=Clostridium thermosuccinogenes TaxID=84032 RepID=A0A2K2FLG4_9CLOT|nr:solute carrier family 23 protein [Pseudoclostridium thermosuccinogenes]AUS96956.1 xanthine permease [Pseudoclostridium thermosuccinogenes]PNT92381.1 xanthine permease [Pseudoclostridium thermosuccinogenes]PNT99627.1 xanthine permease [Pseudoclostridium thermosuccinogenes]PNU01239.1 xanthine permease [Pseudoclostridium thermosuccinogenes]